MKYFYYPFVEAFSFFFFFTDGFIFAATIRCNYIESVFPSAVRCSPRHYLQHNPKAWWIHPQTDILLVNFFLIPVCQIFLEVFCSQSGGSLWYFSCSSRPNLDPHLSSHFSITSWNEEMGTWRQFTNFLLFSGHRPFSFSDFRNLSGYWTDRDADRLNKDWYLDYLRSPGLLLCAALPLYSLKLLKMFEFDAFCEWLPSMGWNLTITIQFCYWLRWR